MRLNGRRIERAHSAARVGDLVTLAQGDRIRVVRILALPTRRGPALEAQGCYEDLQLGQGGSPQLDIDGGAGRE